MDVLASDLLSANSRLFFCGDELVGRGHELLLLDSEYWSGDTNTAKVDSPNITDSSGIDPSMAVDSFIASLLAHAPELRYLRTSQFATPLDSIQAEDFGTYALWFETLQILRPAIFEEMQDVANQALTTNPLVHPSAYVSNILAQEATTFDIRYTTAKEGKELLYAGFKQAMCLVISTGSGLACFNPGELLADWPEEYMVPPPASTPTSLYASGFMDFPQFAVKRYPLDYESTGHEALSDQLRTDIILASIDTRCLVNIGEQCVTGAMVEKQVPTTFTNGVFDTTAKQKITHIIQLD